MPTAFPTTHPQRGDRQSGLVVDGRAPGTRSDLGHFPAKSAILVASLQAPGVSQNNGGRWSKAPVPRPLAAVGLPADATRTPITQ